MLVQPLVWTRAGIEEHLTYFPEGHELWICLFLSPRNFRLMTSRGLSIWPQPLVCWSDDGNVFTKDLLSLMFPFDGWWNRTDPWNNISKGITILSVDSTNQFSAPTYEDLDFLGGPRPFFPPARAITGSGTNQHISHLWPRATDFKGTARDLSISPSTKLSPQQQVTFKLFFSNYSYNQYYDGYR